MRSGWTTAAEQVCSSPDRLERNLSLSELSSMIHAMSRQSSGEFNLPMKLIRIKKTAQMTLAPAVS